ncbi:uncharacterized protein EAF02_007132 [Botrytis sinoallii]|uniref:uncharacterized protein n=1 Tax=Botrytis sinoallii TaxID=1463999 RepID=UPI0019000D49|nr:uncharacterized protein EAF02_007132 [Botrytis sinoallii]KAF7881241.1 hypothetical protein EAF02_007132 [Botrytis sinoallii]
MKFLVITLLACTAIIQSAVFSEAVITSADISISIAFNSIVPDSSEFHFSRKFDVFGILKYIEALIKVIGIITIKDIQLLIEMVIEYSSDIIKNLKEFVRNFLKQLFTRNPDYKKYPAAIYYNKGYSIKNPTGIVGKVNAKLSLGFLHTDYDYIYITGNNQFYTHAENGFINLSYTYNKRCNHDRNTSDLTCN